MYYVVEHIAPEYPAGDLIFIEHCVDYTITTCWQSDLSVYMILDVGPPNRGEAFPVA